jgi:hypothetical protein
MVKLSDHLKVPRSIVSFAQEWCLCRTSPKTSILPFPKEEGFVASVVPITGGFLAITGAVVGLVSTYINVIQRFDELDSSIMATNKNVETSIMATNKTIEATNKAIEKNDLAKQKSCKLVWS